VEVHFPSAAPVEHTTTSHEFHQDAARQASTRLAKKGSGSGLVLMVRNLRGHDDQPFDSRVVRELTLLDARLKTVASFSKGWRIERDARFATWEGSLPPGGYALRFDRKQLSAKPTAMSVWVSPGWQTLVFLPNTESGAAQAWASVQMTRAVRPWEPQQY